MDCGSIAYSRQSWYNSDGLLRGLQSNANNCPRIAPQSQSERSQTAIHRNGTRAQSTHGPRGANSDRNRQYQIELRWDCKTMQDRKDIERIATKSWVIHKLQTNVPNCSRIGLILQSMVDQSTIHQNQSNAGTIFCNRVDCRVIADSRQSHCNHVGTCHNSIFHPTVPTNHCQIRTQSNQSCHNPESPCYQIEMQWDLKTTKDCNVIDRIAKELHRLQADCSNRPPRRGIDSNPNLFGKFQDQSCNPGPISSHLHNPWTINKIPINQWVKCWNLAQSTTFCNPGAMQLVNHLAFPTKEQQSNPQTASRIRPQSCISNCPSFPQFHSTNHYSAIYVIPSHSRNHGTLPQSRQKKWWKDRRN